MGNRWDYEKCKKEILGETNKNKYGEQMTVIEYNGQRRIKVLFDNGEIVETRYEHFKKGEVKNIYSKSLYGVGMLGDIKNFNRGTKEYRKIYSTWRGMLERCYSNEDTTNIVLYYTDVYCAEEWLCFSSFYEWFRNEDNYTILSKSGIRYSIDKDIIIKNNKLYSPLNCCLVPCCVNSLFTKRQNDRGDTPIGVHKENNGSYFSVCSNPYGKPIRHDHFSNPVDAFKQYKKDKEQIIQIVAQDYYSKGLISIKCYEAMINYQVEITD